VLRIWRDLSAEAPRQATFTAGLAGDQDIITVGFVWVGHPTAGPALPSMKPLGKPLTERVVELSYVDLQRIDDTPQGHALRRYWKGHYLRELSDAAIEALVQSHRDPATGGLPNIGLQAYGGAIAEVPWQDTAFAFRDTAFEYVAASRPMAGRYYFLRADPTTVYVLRFLGGKDSMRQLRTQTDQIARTFGLR
jgi:hypothetical protein